MKKEIILCDHCGKEGAKNLGMHLGRRMDAAGSMEDIYEYIDLCQKCMATLIDKLVSRAPYATRKEVISEMRKAWF